MFVYYFFLVDVFIFCYYICWIQVDLVCLVLVVEVVCQFMDCEVMQQCLVCDLEVGLSLLVVMWCLCNLIICSFIMCDLDGCVDLVEVVVIMIGFVDFVVQIYLVVLMQEQIVFYGILLGEELGCLQEMIVLGMGKLGGGELNVFFDIDFIFVYLEDGDI